MSLTFRTKDDYQGDYWKNRWELYLRSVTELIQNTVEKYDVKSVLEIGSNGYSIIKESDTVDIIKKDDYPTFQFDITQQIPWPFEDKKYDLVISTQVWEHLNGGQARAFTEVMRTSKLAIMTFPYRWKNEKDVTHYNISKKMINEWTCNIPPYYEQLFVCNEGKNNRILRLYKF